MHAPESVRQAPEVNPRATCPAMQEPPVQMSTALGLWLRGFCHCWGPLTCPNKRRQRVKRLNPDHWIYYALLMISGQSLNKQNISLHVSRVCISQGQIPMQHAHHNVLSMRLLFFCVRQHAKSIICSIVSYTVSNLYCICQWHLREVSETRGF